MKFEFKERDVEMHKIPLRTITFMMMVSLLTGCFQYEGFTKFTDGCEAVESINSSELVAYGAFGEDGAFGLDSKTPSPITRNSSPSCPVYYYLSTNPEKEEGAFLSFKKISQNTYLGGFSPNISDPVSLTFLLNKFDNGRYHLLSTFPTALKDELANLVGDIPKIKVQDQTGLYKNELYKISRLDQVIGLSLSVRKIINDPDYKAGQLAKSDDPKQKRAGYFFTLEEMTAQSVRPKTTAAPKLNSEDQKLKNKLLGTWECNEHQSVPIRENMRIKWTRIFRDGHLTTIYYAHFIDAGTVVHFARTSNWKIENGNVMTSNPEHHYVSDTSSRLLTFEQTTPTPQDLKLKLNSTILDLFPISKKNKLDLKFNGLKMIEQDQIECMKFP